MDKSTIHILLVEDEKGYAELVRLAFERHAGRFYLTVAGSLEQARAYLAKSLPNLVIADWLLPDGRGTDLLPAAGEARRFPLVVMTNHGDEQGAVEAMKAGVLDYIVKSEATLADMPRVAERALREWGYIVDRKQAEESLRESEEQLRATLLSMDDLVFTLDENGVFVDYYQPEINTELYVPPKVFIGKPYQKVMPPSVVQPAKAAIETLKSTGAPQRFDYSLLLLGQEKWFNMTISMRRDMFGQFAGITAVARNITERVRVEKALRESEERYRAVIQAQTSLIYRYLPDGTITFANDAYCQFYGRPLDEIVGTDQFDTIPAEAQNTVRKHIASLSAENPVATNENRNINIHGESRWFHWTDQVILNADGDTVEYQAVGRDITERVRAEEALQESHGKLHRLNSMLRLMCDNLSEPIWTKDLQGRFMFVNKSCCKDFLNTRDVYEPVGKTDIFFAEREKQSHPENPNYHTFGETCTDSDSAVLETQKVIRGDESGYIKGRFVTFDVIKSPFWDENGELIGTVGCARDVTRERETENERQQVEAEREQLLSQIQTQAHLMRGIMDTVPEGVLLLDSNGCIALANPAAGRALTALVAREDLSTRKPLIRLGDRPLAELLTSPPTKGLWHEVRTDGRIFEVVARPMANDPGPENWVLVIREVTQEREIERRTQQQERLAAVGQLAAGVAHDFNNIMAVIILYTQMSLKAPGLPSKISQYLETISVQAYRATDLVQQILDFSRRAVLERCPMDLTPFLKEAIKLLERTVPESVKIEFTYGADEYTVHADPTRLQQVITNLAVNARDAMPEGGKLHIELERIQVESHKEPPLPEMEAGEWVRVQVTDTGDGIPPEVLPHIFEPFFTTKEIGQGTGLGLAQVYGIVKQHEGHIDVSTEVGSGTTFTLYLPALLSSPPEATAQATESLVQGQGETILVVEDNAALRKALTATLEALNYLVLEAADGRAALDILEQRAGEVSLVLSDLVMPEMGGQALFHTMRQRGLNLPVVMLSGHPLESELEALQTQGLAGWMLKPPDLEQLTQLLAQVLSKDAE